MIGYTKFRHTATVGSKEPAACGKKPPGGRAWKQAPENLKPCPECLRITEAVLTAAHMWLAS